MSNLLVEMGMDAREWAKAWLVKLAEHPEIAADEQTMIGWFANAIMTGYDEGYRKAKAEEAGASLVIGREL